MKTQMSSATASLYKARPERWPQWSLRGIFLLVTLLSVSLGWLGAQLKWIRDRHDLIKSTESIRVSLFPPPPAVRAPWSIHILGESGYESLVIGVKYEESPSAEEEELGSKMESLFPEAIVGYKSYASEIADPFQPRVKHP